MGEEEHIEYIKATIYTTTQGVEALAPILSALGLTGISVEDPSDLDFIIASKETLVWDYVDIQPEEWPDGETRLTFWLEKGSEAKLQELRLKLLKLKSDEQYGLYGKDADFGRLWLDTEAAVNDWKDKYKESFRTFSPCEGIVIRPPWEKAERVAGQLMIVIDPGMAFGTGSHETTSMCLSKLKSLLKNGDNVLDAGTGSGILAIAAALLGASHVCAVEIDPDAAVSAALNIEANGVTEQVSLVLGDAASQATIPTVMRFDLILANLTCSILEGLLPLFNSIIKEDGAMILSGILGAQEEKALEMLENEGLHVHDTVVGGEWLLIEVRK